MKVCVVSLNIVPFFIGDRSRLYGGAEVQAVFVANTLKTCGHEVSLVVADLSDPGRIPFATQNAYNSMEGIRGLRFFHPRWTGVMSALERADADVYYQRNAGMVTGLTARFCRRHGKPFVYGAGSDVDFSLRDVAIHGPRDKMMYGYGLKHASGFVVQNERQRAAAQAQYRQPARIIPNGILPVDATPDAGGDAIVWIGAMWRVKRPELFLELARRMPDRRFYFAGGGGELAGAIGREAAGIANVEMLGRLSRDEVGQLLRRSSVLVNTSSVEGFPNAFLEAWNHGVPVVTFSDVDQIIATTGVGAVCADVDEMVAAIHRITGDVAARQTIRARAIGLVRERFSPAVVGPQYVEFFEEIMSKAAPARAGAVE